MGLRYRAGICVLALVAGSAALQLEPTVIRDLVFDNGSQRMTVGAVRVPLWSSAWAQSPDAFTFENVSFTFGTATYEAKRIEFSGVTSSRAEIEALFSATSAEPMESRLARINAKTITVPEARITQRIGKETQKTTYRNAVFGNVVQGRIASTLVETTATEATGADSDTLFSYGRTTLSDLDLPALARLLETKADSASVPATRIYGGFSIENIGIVDNDSGSAFRIARLSGRDFMGRPTRESWSGTMAIFADMADEKELSSEDQARLLPALADFMGAFDIGAAEATGIEGSVKENDASSPMSVRISRIAYVGGTASQPADLRMEGMEFSGQESRIRLDGMSLTGFSLQPTLEGLKTVSVQALEDFDATAVRALIPTLGTLRLSGLDVDALTTDEADRSVKVQAALKEFELTADRPVNAIPTNIRIGLRNFTMALPSDSTDDGVRELLALGYETIDMSILAAATWDEAANEISLKEVSIQGQDMGSIAVTGLIGNVDKDLFNADTAIATVALAGAKAKSLDITVENKGLFERYLEKAAREQKTTPESLRRTYAGATALIVPALLGNSQQAQTLSQAIARFIAQPGKLMVHATPKDPSGFGLADYVALSDPKDALEKLNITAKAE